MAAVLDDMLPKEVVPVRYALQQLGGVGCRTTLALQLPGCRDSAERLQTASPCIVPKY